MAVSAKINPIFTATEDVALGLDNVSNPTIAHNIAGGQVKLSATSTPAVTKVFSGDVTLSAGAATLSLEALPAGNLPNINLDTLKVQAIKITALSTNTDRILVEDAAVNGYNIFGAAGAGVSLGAGDTVLFYCPESLPDVAAAGARVIDFTSADLDAVCEVMIVAG